MQQEFRDKLSDGDTYEFLTINLSKSESIPATEDVKIIETAAGEKEMDSR